MNLMHKNLQKGFTLVEIIVVIGLFAILGSTLLDFNFNSRKRINALIVDTDNLALEIRDMQNRTLSFTGDASSYNGFGIYLDMSQPTFAKTFYKNITSTNNFITSDIPDLNTPTDNLVFSLANKINRIILYASDSSGTMLATDEKNKLAIFFIKPKAYTHFYFGNSSGSSFEFKNSLPTPIGTRLQNINKACIEMTSSQNEFRHINIFYIGQISQAAGKCKL